MASPTMLNIDFIYVVFPGCSTNRSCWARAAGSGSTLLITRMTGDPYVCIPSPAESDFLWNNSGNDSSKEAE